MAAEKFAIVLVGSIPEKDTDARNRLEQAVERAAQSLQLDGTYLNAMVARYGQLAEDVPGAATQESPVVVTVKGD